MEKYGIQAYLIPSSDPHMNENTPTFWQRRVYISGFTGSAGDAVVTQSKAGLWTDSRYYLQAEHQLAETPFQLFKIGIPGTPTIEEWLVKEIPEQGLLGLDPQTVSHQKYIEIQSFLKQRRRRVKCIQKNLVDAIWDKAPIPPKTKFRIHAKKYAGESMAGKIERVRQKMKEDCADLLVIAALDSIAWLLNIRGSDVKYTPLVIAYALITQKKVSLFVDPDKVPKRFLRDTKGQVSIFSYQDFFHQLKLLASQNQSVWVDGSCVNQRVVNTAKKHSKLITKPNPIPLLKAKKNKTGIAGFKAAHIRDGAAMVRFLCWLELSLKKEPITEQSAAAKLEKIRAQNDLFQGMSFETISAYQEHSAIVHYSSSSQTDIPLKPKGIFLIDSGAHYLDATTDITRTVCLGCPTIRQKDHFTRVLKGLISLSSTSFPQGTTGRQLDTIARLALWQKGLNYGHGTGHGIGTYLSVHEGPHSLSQHRCTGVSLEPGMVTTIEPGFYWENNYGIRLENVVLVKKDEKNSAQDFPFYAFETLTLCPIDCRLIKRDLLSQQETVWLNTYHNRVYRTLSVCLNKRERSWLKKVTSPL